MTQNHRVFPALKIVDRAPFFGGDFDLASTHQIENV